MNNFFCFGFGYTCEHITHALQMGQGQMSSDWNISGTTRDPEKRDYMKQKNINAYIFKYSHPLSDPFFYLGNTTHLLISTPPGDDGDPAFLMHQSELLKIPTLKWVGYLSTTGVYGNRDGDWVDETSEIRPSSKRGSRRARAEEQWYSLYKMHNLPVHIFRLAGIYGPGRSALDSVRTGVANRVDMPGHVSSRVHVEDIVNVILASMRNPSPGSVYNVCDDYPSPTHEVIDYACEILNVEPPPLVPLESANLAPIARSFYVDNKKVRNDKIKQDLGVTLKYPDFRSGLEACLDAESYALKIYRETGVSR